VAKGKEGELHWEKPLLLEALTRKRYKEEGDRLKAVRVFVFLFVCGRATHSPGATDRDSIWTVNATPPPPPSTGGKLPLPLLALLLLLEEVLVAVPR
jgi:hypothetical protein